MVVDAHRGRDRLLVLHVRVDPDVLDYLTAVGEAGTAEVDVNDTWCGEQGCR